MRSPDIVEALDAAAEHNFEEHPVNRYGTSRLGALFVGRTGGTVSDHSLCSAAQPSIADDKLVRNLKSLPRRSPRYALRVITSDADLHTSHIGTLLGTFLWSFGSVSSDSCGGMPPHSRDARSYARCFGVPRENI